jgi:tetratricopeptide (TPR) repeat protein
MVKAVRVGLQMSQSEFATAIRQAGAALGEPNTCNKRLVQKWESGEHTDCRSNYKRALTMVTHTPYEQLGFKSVQQAALEMPVPVVAARSAARAVGLEATVRPAGDEADRLRFALTRPVHADGFAVDVAHATMEKLFGQEQHQRARALMQTVDRQVTDAAILLAGTGREPTRRRLAYAGGACAALAGWLAFDTGDPVAAHRYWDSALASARYASDAPLLALVLVQQSYSAAERGDPANGWQLAHTATTHAATQPRLQAWAAARAAQEAARLGERTAALDELALATALASQLSASVPEDGTVPWARHIDPAYLNALAADVHHQLGEHEQAARHAETAREALGRGRTKTRALILAQIACTGARTGDMQTATECGIEALELADELETTLARRKLRLLQAIIKPYHATPAATQLLQHLNKHTA